MGKAKAAPSRQRAKPVDPDSDSDRSASEAHTEEDEEDEVVENGEQNDDGDYWEALEILQESSRQYLIKWAGEDEHGRPWPHSWVGKDGVSGGLRRDWNAKKLAGLADARRRQRDHDSDDDAKPSVSAKARNSSTARPLSKQRSTSRAGRPASDGRHPVSGKVNAPSREPVYHVDFVRVPALHPKRTGNKRPLEDADNRPGPSKRARVTPAESEELGLDNNDEDEDDDEVVIVAENGRPVRPLRSGVKAISVRPEPEPDDDDDEQEEESTAETERPTRQLRSRAKGKAAAAPQDADSDDEEEEEEEDDDDEITVEAVRPTRQPRSKQQAKRSADNVDKEEGTSNSRLRRGKTTHKKVHPYGPKSRQERSRSRTASESKMKAPPSRTNDSSTRPTRSKRAVEEDNEEEALQREEEDIPQAIQNDNEDNFQVEMGLQDDDFLPATPPPVPRFNSVTDAKLSPSKFRKIPGMLDAASERADTSQEPILSQYEETHEIVEEVVATAVGVVQDSQVIVQGAVSVNGSGPSQISNTTHEASLLSAPSSERQSDDLLLTRAVVAEARERATQAENTELKAEIETLRRRLKEATDDLFVKSEQNMAAQEAGGSSNLDSSQEELTNLRTTLDTVGGERDEAQVQVSLLTMTNGELRAEVDQQTAHAEQLREEIATLRQKVKDLASDRQLFRESYDQASNAAMENKQEADDLRKQNDLLRTQVKEGLAQARLFNSTQVSALQEELRQWKGIAELELVKNRRTEDELRRRAGEHPRLLKKKNELQAQVRDLEEENDRLKTELRAARFSRITVQSAEGPPGSQLDPLQGFQEDEDAFSCRWHLNLDRKCRATFRTKNDLFTHVLAANHNQRDDDD